jgi:hypothetical protein
VKPREWFLVPINGIDEAVLHIREASIVGLDCSPLSGRLIEPKSGYWPAASATSTARLTLLIRSSGESPMALAMARNSNRLTFR